MALSDRDRRALIVLGAVAGVAIIAFILLNVLGGGGGTEAGSPAPVITTSPAPSPSVSPTPTPRETLPPVVLAGSRDPFSIPPALQTTAAPTASGSVGPTTTPPPTGGTSTPPPTSPTETPTTPGGGQSTKVGGHTVVLLDVFAGGTKAQVEVDGKVYTVSEGQTFAGSFELVSISGECARLLFGDEAFTLCTNPQK
ncbi:MAG: hypothetical protein ACE14W_00410 [Candidatus Velamenicoccus archaeovorus]